MKYALHLPQYMSYLLTGAVCSDMTSIGCHTQLWNFKKKTYHDWVKSEGVGRKLAPMADSSTVMSAFFPGSSYTVGVGLHDSSAALIPYLVNFHEPFVLISTGTWCITLNPFNQSQLTAAELASDCLCYLSYQGKPVKASRLFAGHEHEQQVKRIADYFNQSPVRYRSMPYRQDIIKKLRKQPTPLVREENNTLKESLFRHRDLSLFATDVEAYHQLIMDLVMAQRASSNLVVRDTEVKRIFVDGGFSKNAIYMNLMAAFFPKQEVFAASMAQATAIGAALAIHPSWNTEPVPADIIELKYYATRQDLIV
jgi:sugar (pentulose or hexulose) kinase